MIPTQLSIDPLTLQVVVIFVVAALAWAAADLPQRLYRELSEAEIESERLRKAVDWMGSGLLGVFTIFVAASIGSILLAANGPLPPEWGMVNTAFILVGAFTTAIGISRAGRNVHDSFRDAVSAEESQKTNQANESESGGLEDAGKNGSDDRPDTTESSTEREFAETEDGNA